MSEVEDTKITRVIDAESLLREMEETLVKKYNLKEYVIPEGIEAPSSPSGINFKTLRRVR